MSDVSRYLWISNYVNKTEQIQSFVRYEIIQGYMQCGVIITRSIF